MSPFVLYGTSVSLYVSLLRHTKITSLSDVFNLSLSLPRQVAEGLTVSLMLAASV